MNLRNRLMLMALVLVVAVMTVSTGVAYLILDRQSRAAAGDLLGKAFNLIEDELRDGRTKLAGGASQLTGVDKMPVKVKYVSEYAAKTKEPEIRPTYGEMLEALRGTVRANDLWKAAIYGADGALIAYAVSRPEGLLLGYSHPFPAPSHHGKLVKPGEELGIDTWAAGDLPSDGFAQNYPGQPPASAGVGLTREGSFICLAARTPITGKVYNRKTDAFEDKQLGLVVALIRLDQSLVERLARLTGTQVDIFTSQGLSVGSLPGLEQLPAGLESFTPGQAAGERAEVAQGAVPDLGEVAVDQADYYLAVQPLREGQQDLGAIACLYSKAIAQRNSGQMIRLLALAALVCVVLTLPAALVFAQRLSRPIDRTIGELTDMSHQMTAAAGEVSAASQALAENASSQAGSLEEVSAALAETTQVAQENQRHAQQADVQSRESIANLQSANQAMKGLMRSMQETSQASDSVIKVVQTIDGIAFQINLLALNAAVEAARAGSAGAGFAVVADEVRNLAMRSAEASQNTRQLLEEIIQRVRAGTQEVGNTDQLYGKVAVGVKAVTGLVGEIARASDEQLREVEQVGAAIQTINAGTQHSAANSQQSASASEQMSAQAAHMQGQIDILRAMIEGRKAARRERG